MRNPVGKKQAQARWLRGWLPPSKQNTAAKGNLWGRMRQSQEDLGFVV